MDRPTLGRCRGNVGLFGGERPASFASNSFNPAPAMRSFLYIVLLVLDIYIWLLIRSEERRVGKECRL